MQEDLEKLMAGESVALRNTYAMEKNDPENLAAATIPVENINGPVLLVSGTDSRPVGIHTSGATSRWRVDATISIRSAINFCEPRQTLQSPLPRIERRSRSSRAGAGAPTDADHPWNVLTVSLGIGDREPLQHDHGTVADHALVSPDSKPSEKISPRVRAGAMTISSMATE